MNTTQCNVDSTYRNELAQAVGCAAENLVSVLSEQELKELLQNKLKRNNFLVGNDFENVKNGTFNINLHIHTHYSDGSYTVSEVLDDAVKYADYRIHLGHKDPFILALTDHDNLFAVQEAIKLIAQTPERYANIRFVAGIEFNSYFLTENIHKKQLEVLAYCINPFKTEEYVEKIRQANLKYIRELINVTGNTTFDELLKVAQYARAGGSPALMWEFFEIVGHSTENKRIIDLHNETFGDLSINPGSPEISELVQAIKQTGCGFLSIAHPGRPLNGFELNQLFQQFVSSGIEAIEANYHYIKEDKVCPAVQEQVSELTASMGLLATGGIDCHKNVLFLGREPNPPELPDISVY